MAFTLIEDIIKKIFSNEEKRLVIVHNSDKFLERDDVRFQLSYASIRTYLGTSLDLRILRETELNQESDMKYLFIMKERFDILDDIMQDAEFVPFQIKSFFRFYHWDTIKNEFLSALEWLYKQHQRVPLDQINTTNIISEYYDRSEERANEVFLELKLKWNSLMAKPNFNRPSVWMPEASKLILKAIELEKWDEMTDEVDEINNQFKVFLKKKYINIVSSTCGKDAPKIVNHILPFINKQEKEKSALIVVDGMNYWQSIMLGESIEEHIGATLTYECIFSWLPSTTDLSRQAIFRGDFPQDNYPQSPQYEEKLWKQFWEFKRLPNYQQFYQHSGEITIENSVTKLAYVVTDLDDKMHASDNYYYLFDYTKRWVEEDEILQNIEYLLERGFKIYITTDHGNLETVPYKRFTASDRLGSNESYRHIKLPEEASRELFEREHQGHIFQIDDESRTYFAVGREAFTNKSAGVTHGGTHWLEVLIPFITITKI